VARNYVGEYFDNHGALRALCGFSASSPTDDDLTTATARAVQIAEKAMGGQRGFAETKTLIVFGSGVRDLYVPYPLYSITSIAEENKSGLLTAGATTGYTLLSTTVMADGGWDEFRVYPRIEKYDRTSKWSNHLRYTIIGSWGMVTEDGTTPEDMKLALARLVVLNSHVAGDEEAIFRRKLGNIVTHRVGGRTVRFRGSSVGKSNLIAERWVWETLMSYRVDHISSSSKRIEDVQASRQEQRKGI